MKRYERLEAWQAAHQLVLLTYRVTKTFPREELYGLTSQSRRAAFSVVANIAEGSAKRGPREFRRYLDIALGSLSELSVALRLAKDLELLSEDGWRAIERLRNHAGTLVWRLYAAVGKTKRQVGSPPTARYRPIPPVSA